ncbi:hypothetical protein SAMN05216570_3235 [Dyella sp. OK004]|uniref:DUF6896 domain-containing protein n=1 Tax=Dyella sp. OK004 TaxID=1855292 RepID=UPI0008ED9043|nr:hypothetical protein [Dyella sp. OK004]SFS15202.1 hypothetical protein SAMN05216570_3235 [Dyella sp. OK004]
MDARLLTLIHEYLSAIRSAVTLMVQSGIPLPSSNLEWALNRILGAGELVGGVRYQKHGYGCEVFLLSGRVDFDFGANGEYDGFDPWRLKSFAEGRLAEYGFSSEQEVDDLFGAAVQSGALAYSGRTLYYLRRMLSSIS